MDRSPVISAANIVRNGEKSKLGTFCCMQLWVADRHEVKMDTDVAFRSSGELMCR